MKRSGPPTRTTELRRTRKRLRARSAARTRADATLAESRKTVETRSGGRCEARTPVCTGRAVPGNVHHRARRGFPECHDPELLLACCSACHPGWIHVECDHDAAIAAGWLIDREALLAWRDATRAEGAT